MSNTQAVAIGANSARTNAKALSCGFVGVSAERAAAIFAVSAKLAMANETDEAKRRGKRRLRQKRGAAIKRSKGVLFPPTRAFASQRAIGAVHSEHSRIDGFKTTDDPLVAGVLAPLSAN
ncbi:MAG: hypothetical protein LBO72_02955 [Helicobacteraceae bacterium]|jgi:hypothetical protein|nr:hypothetical protein [Helicobacteraceae bacterium]